MSKQPNTETSSTVVPASCSQTMTSEISLAELRKNSDAERNRRQQELAQQEYLRLKERLSPLGYSEAALRAKAQSYMLGHPGS